MKLLMLKGLPASGKSTYAKTLTDFVEVNKDDIRAEILDGKWNPKKEKLVLKVRDERIIGALQNGQNVVSSDTNLNPRHEERLRQIARENGAEFEEMFFNVDLQTAIERDNKRENTVGESVIRNMWQKYIRPSLVVKQSERLTPCIIFDIDGTLAHMQNRSPYAWDKVDTDTPDIHVKEILDFYRKSYIIIILTGRDGSCYEMTKQWLEDNEIFYDYLYSREAGDSRKDSIVKRELWEKYIKDNYFVHAVFDDRNQVVDMWRDMGFKVFQVADGNF